MQRTVQRHLVLQLAGKHQTTLHSRCLQEFMDKLPLVESLHAVCNVLYGLAVSGQQIPQDQLNPILAVAVRQGLLARAVPQDISSIGWSAATLGLCIPEPQVQELVACLISKSADADPQAIGNILWAVATMQLSMSQKQLQHLVACLISKLADAKPQAISNTLWAVATMKQRISETQLQQLVACLIGKSAAANAQGISNAVWALAIIKQNIPSQQLEQLLAHLISNLAETDSQHVSNTLWACGEMRYFPQQLLAAVQEQRVWQTLLPAMEPHGLGQVAIALGALGHRDDKLMAAVLQQAIERMQQQQHANYDSPALTNSSDINSSSGSSSLVRTICNLCWSVVVLDMQQYITQVLTLVQYCAKHFEGLETEGLDSNTRCSCG